MGNSLKLLALLIFFAQQNPAPAADSYPPSRQILVAVKHFRHREIHATAECNVQAPPEILWKVLLAEENEHSKFVPKYLFTRLVPEVIAGRLSELQPKSFRRARELIGDEKLTVSEKSLTRASHRLTTHFVLLMNLPWPIADRWGLVKQLDQWDSASNTYTRSYRHLVGNLVKNEGKWTVSPLQGVPAWSRVFFESATDSGIQAPSFIIKPSAERVTKGILEAIRYRAETLANP